MHTVSDSGSVASSSQSSMDRRDAGSRHRQRRRRLSADHQSTVSPPSQCNGAGDGADYLPDDDDDDAISTEYVLRFIQLLTSLISEMLCC